jgi:hypothetical protein
MNGHDVTGGLVDITHIIERLLALNPPASRKARKGNGQQHDASGSTVIDLNSIDEVIAELIEYGTENGQPVEHRGEKFYKVVAYFRRDHSLADVMATLEAHPNGVQGKYDGRLEKQLRDCWDKLEPGAEFQPEDGNEIPSRSGIPGGHSDASESGPKPSASSPGDSIDTGILRLNRRRPPRFPVEMFGLEWAPWVEATAAGAACPIDYVAAPLLATASALIGNARWAMAWPSWAEPPHLWMGSIGDSGDGKTPGTRSLQDRIVPELERRMIGDFPDQLRMWKANVQIAAQRSKMWEREMAEALKKGAPLPARPLDVDPDPEPQKPRLIMRDVTLEKVASVLAVAAPKGLLMVRGELAGWLLGMNQYNDAARAYWLEAYDGAPYSVDRKTTASINVARNVVAWSGGVQPERLAQLMAEPDDGLFARFNWCWPDPIPFQQSSAAPDIDFALEALDRLRLLELHRNAAGTLVPIFVPLAQSAWPRLVAFANEMQRRKDLSAGLLRSSYGKTRGVALRLGLILEHLWWCGRNGIDPPPTEISDAALERACMWVRDYAIPMAERTFVDAAASQADRNVVTLAGWIVEKQPVEVHVRTMQREVRLPGLTEAAAIHAACRVLVDARWLLPGSTAHGKDRNRAVYPVNPDLWPALGRKAP